MYFVTGASGRLGQLVAGEVVKQGAERETTLGSRDVGKLSGFKGQGFKTAVFDFDDPQSMRDALKGHRHMLLISGDTPNEKRISQHKAAVDAAKASGARSIAYTSFTNASAASRFTFAKAHAETEAYIKASGLDYAFLRNNQYAENIANAIAHAKQTGAYAVYGSKGKVAYLPRADVAFAAATALLKSPAGHAVYEITGPKAYDAADIARTLSRKWAKPVTAAELPREALISILETAKLPGFFVEALVGLHEANAAGEMAAVSGDFRKLTGREPESLESFLDRTA
ncbi:NAD(P)H-binding protein [Taklimakanibacter deserti]|uniref:NAD(P)H-binding protein n=1 Tax=Taklimakanibacter deserti TaxID=2267839 RepID=UPI000E646974